MDEKVMQWIFAVLSILVAAVWLVGQIAPLWKTGYEPPPELNVVMMAIVGVFVSLYTKARNPRDKKDDEE